MADNSSSSSSYGCCTISNCAGTGCVHFSTWTLTGANYYNTDNCQLYIVFDSFGLTIQQVEIYKDSSYLELVAIGQGTVGNITLSERNSSGLSGSVTWDGTAVSYSTALLRCDSLTSSSSTTLSTSSSTSLDESSLSTSSLSSSSSGCCTVPYCTGTSCIHLSSWNFSGMNDGNTDSCRLYVGFENFGTVQQIRIYKDNAKSYLVAIGQGTVGNITLSERNSSGLSGSVTWDGTAIGYTEEVYLDCYESSSSSSSSYSSSSSSQSSNSSSSKSSKSSFSSSSSSSTDSSSSIDSHSSSSESEGNESTSSSSIGPLWNKTKPLTLGFSAINSLLIQNRLAQTVIINTDTYDIGKVYCYLYGKYGNDSFTLNLGLYECNNSGQPQTLVSSKTLASTSITNDGWYYFDFSITGITPSNNLLSFVLWQTGGDEDNYALWGYVYTSDLQGTSAWISNDGTTWVRQSGILRGIKLLSNFTFYDLTNYQILTPPANEECKTQILNSDNPEYNETKYIDGGDYGIDKVMLDYPNLLASFIVDASGSMGWNDRFNKRIDFLRYFINRLRNKYPSTVLVDIIKMGSQVLDTSSVYDNIGQVMTINIDLNRPDRTTYVFTVTSANATSGDIYTNDNINFTVFSTIAGDTTLICIGGSDPLDSGVLTKVSGAGDATITYSTYTKLSTLDSFNGMGFKGLDSTNSYNIAEIDLGINEDEKYDEISLTNWNAFSNSAVTLSLGSNGPRSVSSIDFTATPDLVLRKTLSNRSLSSTRLTQNVVIGDTEIFVEDASIFELGDTVSIIDGNNASINHVITELDEDTNKIIISPSSIYNISVFLRGIVQEYYSPLNSIVLNSITTGKILIRDISYSTGSIIFFVQNDNGYYMEWDIEPFTEWIIHNLYWISEGANFQINGFDTNGNPLSNDTQINFYVDEKPTSEVSETQIPSAILLQNALVGDNIVYVSDNTGYSISDKIDLINGVNRKQTVTITEVGTNTSGDYIKFTPLLIYNFYIADGSMVVKSVTVQDISNASSLIKNSVWVPASIALIDVTPIYTEQNLDSSLLLPYDITPLPFSTNVSSLNTNENVIKYNKYNAPIIDNTAYIRIMPITEDNIKTKADKDSESSKIIRPNTKSNYISQLEQSQNDFSNAASMVTNATTTSMTSLITRGTDYTIDNPVYLADGYASSHMQSFAQSLSETSFTGIKIPNIEDDDSDTLQVKKYEIYPIMVLENNGRVVAQRILPKFEPYFTPDVVIYSNYNGGNVSFIEEQACGEDCPEITCSYTSKSARGVYATSGNSFSIDYTVLDKFELVDNGTLNITIYSNTIMSGEDYIDKTNISKQFFNIVQPDTLSVSNGVSQTTSTLTNIDVWRTEVDKNPISNTIDTTDTDMSNETQEYNQSLYGYAETKISISASENGYSTTSSNTSTLKSFPFYENSYQWTLAKQYTVYQTTLTIVNGRATLNVPASDVAAVLIIEASYSFGNNLEYESIRTDAVINANPIDISGISPFKIYAKGGTDKYSMGVNVLWGGNSISDNVIVNFNSDNTPIYPSVAKTDGGWAGGILIGPHNPVTLNCSDDLVAPCPECWGEFEDIEINVSYLGFSRTVNRKIQWMGEESTETDPYFYVRNLNSNDITYANGRSFTRLRGSIDPADDDGQLTDLWIGVDWDGIAGVSRLNGLNQLPNVDYPSGAPSKVVMRNASSNFYEEQRWLNKTVVFSIPAINKNIGYEQPDGGAPWESDCIGYTGWRLPDSGNPAQYTSKIATGVKSLPYVGDLGSLVIPYPTINYTEPLDITLSTEPTNTTFIRDGIHSCTIVADVTWEGEFIKDIFENKPYYFPIVTFKAGTCAESNAIERDGEQSLMKDTRNLASGCLRISDNPDILLTEYSVQVSLSRTTYQENHTHSCSVDSNGNGYTNSVISLDDISVFPHTHTITNYLVLPEGTPSHIHALRSVAITELKPMSNIQLDININAYVIYDPTGCTSSFSSTPPGGPPLYSPNGNRLMFATLKFPSTMVVGYRNPRLLVNIESPNDLYTASNVLDITKCMNVKISAGIYANVVQNNVTTDSLIRIGDIPDGTRVIFNINVYKPIDTNNISNLDNTFTSDAEAVRRYLYLYMTATIHYGIYTGTTSKIVEVRSNLSWFPNIQSLLPEPTIDNVYVNNALDEIDTIGSSPIHDSVEYSANKIMDYEEENSNLQSYKKIIFLLTDGDENTSKISIDQALVVVNAIDGKQEVPVIPIKLGYTYSSDEVLLKKYAISTNGSNYYMVSPSDTIISEVTNDIITSGTMGVNYGTYTNTIDIYKDGLFKQLSFDSVYVPSNAKLLFRSRYSLDQITWTDWTGWTNITSDYDFMATLTFKGRYFQYQVSFYGNENFESPELRAGATLCYYKAQNFTLFFQPINLDINTDEYVASIHITHEGTIPITSTINYGCAQFNTVDPNDYYSVTRPVITPDRHTILLIRYNESLLTDDYKTYIAINGGWPKDAQVELFKIVNNSNGVLVSSSEYTFNYINGKVTFYNYQNSTDKFIICVGMGNVLRIICNIVNYGPQNIILDHIGVLYNITKRIPYNSDGSILNKSINMRLT